MDFILNYCLCENDPVLEKLIHGERYFDIGETASLQLLMSFILVEKLKAGKLMTLAAQSELDPCFISVVGGSRSNKMGEEEMSE